MPRVNPCLPFAFRRHALHQQELRILNEDSGSGDFAQRLGRLHWDGSPNFHLPVAVTVLRIAEKPDNVYVGMAHRQGFCNVLWITGA